MSSKNQPSKSHTNPTPCQVSIAILGISANPERYSNKAACMLREHGYHNLYGVSPSRPTFTDIPVVGELSELRTAIDTLTVYVNPAILGPLTSQVTALKPRRVILNPGTENEPFAKAARAAGIEVVEACTLVLLRTNAF